VHPIDPAPDGRLRLHPESAADLRAWLAAHGETHDGAWIVTWKAAAARAELTYDELVRACLCFGWVDGQAGKVDEHRMMRWCSPRKPGSGWAATNKARVAELEEAGLMEPAGRAVIERAQADGSWTLLDSVEALIVPEDLAAALDARAGAREHWDAFPPSAQKFALAQVALAKREATRAARIAKIADAAARGERIG